MIGLGVFLLILGAFAAYNVHQQQQTSSEIVAHQVNSMLAIHELNIVMREIRFQVVAFLRTHDAQHLSNVSALNDSADVLLDRTKELARPGREQERSRIVEAGYRSFFTDFRRIMAELSKAAIDAHSTSGDTLAGTISVTPEQTSILTELSDGVLTNHVLKPLEECLADNRQFVEDTNRASQVTAQHLKIGFLLLGICGAVAGLLLGTVIARTIGQSIVQLNVTVRSVAGRLSDVSGPVTFSRTGGLADINLELRQMERDIAVVVERLQQRETELLRSEQLAHLGQLAAGMAHELRNPLMPMKILVQAALERNDEAGLKGRALQVLNDEIVRLEDSISSFLDYARPPTPHKMLLDVREVLTGTLDLVAPRARQQGVELETQLPDVELLAEIDRGQIRQLLLNLLLNALDAMPRGGVIQCALEANGSVEEPALVGAANIASEPAYAGDFSEHDALRVLAAPKPPATPSPKKWLAIRVADNGPGVPELDVQTIFEPFVTTKETGTGLGLTVCRRIAVAHDGELTVRNRASGGSEFILLLPRCG